MDGIWNCKWLLCCLIFALISVGFEFGSNSNLVISPDPCDLHAFDFWRIKNFVETKQFEHGWWVKRKAGIQIEYFILYILEMKSRGSSGLKADLFT
uniref:Uncharacterized protein n=1 Tax=Nelumbo nucifera TaxID=4432 RepID=A0A822XKE6_NELNU|nr:TPA_asm: hypothetical protein HUJ06_020748 [Nelumbo nucifera]